MINRRERATLLLDIGENCNSITAFPCVHAEAVFEMLPGEAIHWIGTPDDCWDREQWYLSMHSYHWYELAL